MVHAWNLDDKFSQFKELWTPHVIGEFNGQSIKIARIKGSFVWHSHHEADEVFYVYRGSFTMEFRDKKIELSEGDFIIVPKNTEHRPVAEEECMIVLLEPLETINTGNTKGPLTVNKLKKI